MKDFHTQKYKENISILGFYVLHFLLMKNVFYTHKSICLINTVVLTPILTFFLECHKMSFNVMILQLPYDIKYHRLCQYGHQKNRID